MPHLIISGSLGLSESVTQWRNRDRKFPFLLVGWEQDKGSTTLSTTPWILFIFIFIYIYMLRLGVQDKKLCRMAANSE